MHQFKYVHTCIHICRYIIPYISYEYLYVCICNVHVHRKYFYISMYVCGSVRNNKRFAKVAWQNNTTQNYKIRKIGNHSNLNRPLASATPINFRKLKSMSPLWWCDEHTMHCTNQLYKNNLWAVQQANDYCLPKKWLKTAVKWDTNAQLAGQWTSLNFFGDSLKKQRK